MKLDYHIKYSNRKTLNISVERDKRIIVRAPRQLSEERVAEIVRSKRQWIKEKLKDKQKYPDNPEHKEFVSGETLMYLGKNYRLVVTDEPIDGIAFNQQFKISKTNQSKANQLFKN